MTKFSGIYPALITPFTSNGKINAKAMEQIIHINLEKGVSGFYVGGSTAEAFLLSPEERKTVLEIAMKAAGDKVQIIANIGMLSTEQGIDLAKHADKLGVSAISSVPPFYYQYTIHEYYKYYVDISNTVSVPMLIYNVPAMSKVNFSEEDFVTFFKSRKIIGVKYTSYDLFLAQKLISRFPKKILFIGHDEIFLSAIAAGAKAAIGSTMCFMAEKFIQIRNCFNNHDMKNALKIQDEVNKIIAVLIKIGVFKGVKAALELQGIPCGQCRKPFQPLNSQELQELKEVLDLYK
ncbi:MAG: N-acetylneuraminate lyase [Treponema sp.]|jgi:N-acetylneuraminate lyase|nr:N-acetylneuraminate lyase [Treponema sp.]